MAENIAQLHQNHAEAAEDDELVKVHGLGLTQRSASETDPEFFEFLSDLSYDMCPADDIIFCGKLIPLNEQHIPFQTPKDYSSEENRNNIVLRKRSESFSELSITRSDSTKECTKRLRNSRSLDYKKLRRYDMERNRKPEVSAIKVNKRRWYVFMLGMVKFPPEMELNDIKNRQFRRNTSVMFPTVEDYGKRLSGNLSSGKGSSWNLLKALSCRDHSSVAVATSLWMPQS